MADSPVIETARLRIVTFANEHLTPRYVGWLNNQEIVRYSQQRLFRHSLQSCREYWESFAGTPNYFWAIVAIDSQLGHIGNMSAYVEPANYAADLSILIGEKSSWGQGYGSEAWIAACDYLLNVAGLHKVTAGTLSVNLPMLGIMRRAGMAEDGRANDRRLFEGREVDIVYAAKYASRSRVGESKGTGNSLI